jgi:hypothetical protein
VGRPPYQVVYRLYLIAEDRWAEIDGTYAHVNLLRLPIYRFLNCVYTWCIEHLDPSKREEWDTLLLAPLPGREKEVSEVQVEQEGAAFMALMQSGLQGISVGPEGG